MVKLKEGDTMQLGGSRRLYRLHWLPFTLAYDSDNLFVPPLDTADAVKETKRGIYQVENGSYGEDDKIQSSDDILEDLQLLFSNENPISSVQKMSPSAPPMPGDMNDSFSYKEEAENKNSLEIDHGKNSTLDAPFASETSQTASQMEYSVISEVKLEKTSGSKGLFACGDIDEKQIFTPDKEKCSPKLGQENTRSEFISRSLFYCAEQDEIFTPENSEVKSPIRECSQTESVSEDPSADGDFDKKQIFTPNFPLFQSRENVGQENSRSEFISRFSSCVSRNKEAVIFAPDNAEVKSPICEYLQTEKVLGDAFARGDSVKKHTPDNQNISSNSLILQSLENMSQENSRRFPRVQDEEEIFTPDNSEVKSPSRGSVSDDPFDRSDRVKKQIFTPDKENCSSNSLALQSLEKKDQESDLTIRTLFSCVHEDEEIFTPDKENMTPNTLRPLKEVDYLKSYRSSPLNKENQCVTVLQKQKLANSASKSYVVLEKKLDLLKTTADRKPLQSLLVNSTSNSKTKSKASDLDTTRCGISINSFQLEEVNHSFETIKEDKKRWTMVVDVACLLNKKSRKELQLLRGLKGTGLIVPRIVIRELDCMLRRGTFFRRTTEVSAALQWIEDCMKNAEGWIHVQSLAEERRPVAPNTEDHILECAVFFKRNRNCGQLVLLSDDVTLKIKAMSEGVICETAEEFRSSLVNPFSNRFLYKDSSPRGHTWTCVDDVVLKDKYYPGSLKKLSKSGEGVKGLKLILLHNINFGKSQLNKLAVNSAFRVR